MHEEHHELPTAQQPTPTTSAPDSAASCRVRIPYPASAPGVTEAPGAEGAPGSAGPGAPTETGATRPSRHAAQTPKPQRRLRQPRLRERRVHPRYSDSEFTDLAHAAALSRMQIGGYVAEASLAAARAEDPTAAIADYRAMVKALMAANRQLGMIGNNLNQLTWHLHKDGAWPEPDVVYRLLARIETSIADVDTAVAQVTEGRQDR